MEPGDPGRFFSLYPSGTRSVGLAILCFLLGIPGVMAWLVENGPGSGDDLLYVFLSVPWVVGGVYLLRRRSRPIVSADPTGIRYVPYDDPVARVRYGRDVRVQWPEIRSISFELLGSPAVVPFMIIRTFDDRRVQLPLAALGMTYEQLAERLRTAAGPHPLPFEDRPGSPTS